MRLVHIIIGAGVLMVGIVTSGCEKAIFPESVPRTQYERYQRLRGEHRPMSEKNLFGGTQPALRERLSPLE